MKSAANFTVFNIQAIGFTRHYSKESLEINSRNGELGVINGTT